MDKLLLAEGEKRRQHPPEIIFLSHALPEDNEFARWLALRLAREGYPVWCDLTKLLGGEDFWSDIEEAIRNRTTKFLFVLFRTSNAKPGVLQELALAKRVGKGREDFVIPLKIDDLASDETTIELTRLNSIDFRGGWVGGLAKLLEKLEKDGVPKDPRFNAAAVATWWQDNLYSGQALIARSEPQACNWFPLRSRPLCRTGTFLRAVGIRSFSRPCGIRLSASPASPARI